MIKVSERRRLSTALSTIDIGQRQHPSKPSRVKALAVDMELFGMRYPIRVRRITAETFKVVCGASRLRAARLLGWDKIDVEIVVGLPTEYLIDELNDDLWSKKLPRNIITGLNLRLNQLREQLQAEQGTTNGKQHKKLLPDVRADTPAPVAVREPDAGHQGEDAVGEGA